MRQIIFESQHQTVIAMPGDGDVLFITFGELMSRPDGVVFWADKLFEKLGTPCIGFVAADSNWYPYQDTVAAITAVLNYIQNNSYKRVVCYGFSMGAYAALKFGRLLTADTVVCFSPQYSICPHDIGEFDRRYVASYIPALHDGMAINETDIISNTVIFVDRGDRVDAKHASYIQTLKYIDVVLVAMCGHDTVRLVSETGIAQALFLSILSEVPGPQRVAKLRGIIREVRHKSFSYWLNSGRRIKTYNPSQIDCWRNAYFKAQELRPEPPIALIELCEVLSATGHLNEVQAHTQILEKAARSDRLHTRALVLLEALGAVRLIKQPAEPLGSPVIVKYDRIEFHVAAATGDFDKVIRLIKSILADDDITVNIIADAVRIVRKLGLHAWAVLLLYRVIEVEGYLPEHRLDLGESLQAMGAKSRARAVIGGCKPQDLPPTELIRLWNALRTAGLFSAAASFVEEIVSQDTRDSFRRLHFVNSLIDVGRRDEAILELDRTLSDLSLAVSLQKRISVLHAAWSIALRGRLPQAGLVARLYLSLAPSGAARVMISDWLETYTETQQTDLNAQPS